MTILIIVAKLLISSSLLYGYYHWFLRNQRFHHYNRFYLLAAILLSVVIPFVNIPFYLLYGHQPGQFIQTLKVINMQGWEEPVTIYAQSNHWLHWFNFQTALVAVYAAGLLTGMVILIRSLLYIFRIKKSYPYQVVEQFRLYNTDEPGTPFSFFNAIFWDRKMDFNDRRGQQIFRHELFHVKQRHSIDILFMEIITALCWFNPFFHLIKKELKAIHEFLADEYAISDTNSYDYAELLVMQAMQLQSANSITHPFFHHPIKRRIAMITQVNLGRRSGYISRIMALPLLFILLSAFAVKFTHHPSNGSAHFFGKKMTVVIDAAHGGRFAGATNGKDLQEKDIALGIVQKIKALSGDYNLTVILTRTTDELVGNASSLSEDLQNRISIANGSNADLLVSIHLGATSPAHPSASGFLTYVSGKRDLPQSKVLASALLNNLRSIYQVNETIQQRQSGVAVLDKTQCPSVILECGYLTNPNDVAFITNATNQEKIARQVLEGIAQYASTQDRASAIAEPATDQISASDTLTAEELSQLNTDDIKTITADMPNNVVRVVFKDGKIRYANAKQVHDFYTAHPVKNLSGQHVMVNSKGAVAEITFIKDTVPGSGHKIFTKVEEEAAYPGGQPAWVSYLIKTLTYPKAAIDKNIQGNVVVQFIVDENGKLSDIKAISGPKALQAESIRVIKESGNWISAMQNGKKVKAYKRQPINFVLKAS